MSVKLDITGIDSWGFKHDGPFIIAGPCSAESREQLLETARGIADKGVHMLRAGIWKPRTRPNCFEGMGEEGLKWLVEAGKETGLPICCECANPEHVELCLKYGVDLIWIGARTTVNPFAVQALADALEGSDIPVLVKNPINPDVELWIGALERLNKAGIKKLGAIHRGFSSARATEYRNAPNWRIFIELRRRCEGMPIICDPSHLCGKRELIPAVAQKALDLLFDGLMIESHNNPDAALSDSKQQFTPEDLGKVIAGLESRHPALEDEDFIHEVEKKRIRLEEIDDTIVELLAERMALGRKIGKLKRSRGIALLQPAQWKKTVEKRTREGIARGMDEHFMLRIFQYIHEESLRQQESVLAGEE
ncbi:bifunctional 3-deoxy-7-phosphoheptulonate synthase/chorismate mutase type II [Maridesulfovibrio hydrothermalis]|uniref:chorismate mutase n=1 Tax=Maridesulfovibrio hydrothermalis AM13 = DSM 14728 TaxID=1121451 RepID=L0R829_9BACT|nr:bifunctional 3-deoxy-7-phosphoheptulonate synthase/chorismate mutase type II [Maridesulfovibrio hydrothermalis]CCO22387.1 DAHP synthetase I/KDSA [Maridesulfovibrio hydrothermalis AM13 = DSM 14728]